jgi:transmembrane sensor
MRTKGPTKGVALARVQAEAAAWVALLHSSERNAEIEAGLRRWITADPLHATVWEVTTDIWNETSSLPRRIPAPPVRRAYFRPVLATATVLCLTVAGIALQHFLHSRVNTAIGEQRTLNLEDGTRVELNTDSHLVVKYDHDARTVILQSGEAYFQVARELRPFMVVAGERKILALGTAFTVRRDQSADDSLTVTLIEGRVAVAPVDVTSAAGSTSTLEVKTLNAGERLRVAKHHAPTLDSPPMDKVTGWMRGQLIFDHTPLPEAIAEFNRYSSLKITVASAEIATIPVGGIFRISDAKSFARAVAETHNLRLTLKDGALILDKGEPASSRPDTAAPNP